MILHFLLGLVTTAQATSYYIQPFSQFTHEASAIVHGTLSNIHTENGTSANGQKVIYTYAALEAKEVLKGPINVGQSVLVREIGGTKDGYTLDIPGNPVFTEGEDTVLYLGPENADQSREITSLELGKFGTQEKNGETTLTGGMFNYAKRSDHNMGDPIPENLKPWTLADVRALVKKQGGKEAPPQAASTPYLDPKIEAAALANSGKKAEAPVATKVLEDTRDPHETTEGSNVLYYGIFGIIAAGFFFFLFRKR